MGSDEFESVCDDHIHYKKTLIPSDLVVPWPFKYREHFRNPATEMIHHRYREDWV